MQSYWLRLRLNHKMQETGSSESKRSGGLELTGMEENGVYAEEVIVSQYDNPQYDNAKFPSAIRPTQGRVRYRDGS